MDIRAISKLNAQYFEKSADSYLGRNTDFYRATNQKLFVDHFANRLDRSSHLPAIEVGQGAGLLTESLISMGLHCVILDSSRAMLDTALTYLRSRHNNVDARLTAIHGDVLDKCHIEGMSFQALVLQAVIHLFPKTTAIEVLTSLTDRLVNGGLVWIATTVGDEAPEGFYIDADPKRPSDRTDGVSSFRAFYTEEQFRCLVQRASLEIIEEVENVDDQRARKRRWLNLVCKKQT